MHTTVARLLTVLTLLHRLGSAALAQPPDPGPAVVTPHETIPNPVFGSAQRVSAVCKGIQTPCAWESPTTWTTGQAPGAGSLVIVDGDVRVTSTGAVATSVGIYPGGRLSFATATTTRLATGEVVVHAGGALEVGTAADPISVAATAEIVIRDLPFTADPGQHLKGIIVVDGTLRIHGWPMPQAFLRLAAPPAAGATTVAVASSALDAGWQVGDTVLLPKSSQCRVASGPCAENESETRVVQSISADGRTLTLNAPLTFAHPGGRRLDGVVDLLPHVLNLRRNAVVRSENPSGVRGHVLVHGRADVDIRYGALQRLGRTDIRDLGPTNQKGRYPLHAHHLIGPLTSTGSGFQFAFVGNVIDFGAENRVQLRKWGIAVHGSHFGLVENNIVDHSAGAGIATDDASETGNVFRRNFVVRVVGGTGARTHDPDPGDFTKLGRAGVGYWFNGGGGNTFEDNVAADVFECTYCYGFKFDNVYVSTALLPRVQGDDPHASGGVPTDPYTIGLRRFVRNEAYAVPNGLTIWWMCTEFETPRDACTSTVDGFRVWHHHRWGYFGYETSRMTLQGFTHRGDASVLTNVYESPTGLYLVDYLQRLTVVRNADIQGAATGIVAPVNADVRGASGRDAGQTMVVDSFIGAVSGVEVFAPSSTNGADSLSPQTLILDHVRFAFPSTRAGTHVWFGSGGAGGSTSQNLQLRNEVWIRDYDRAPGQDGPDLYLIPRYQPASTCDAAVADCSVDLSASYPLFGGARVYRLQPIGIPSAPTGVRIVRP